MVGGRSLSTNDRRATFVRLVADGQTPAKAAEKAGYSHPAPAAYRLMREPEIVRAVQEAGEARSAGLVGAALSTCLRLMNVKYPPATQLGAAKAILEHDRRIRQKDGDGGGDDKPLEEQTDDELMQRLERIRDRMRQAQQEADSAQDDAPIEVQAIEYKE